MVCNRVRLTVVINKSGFVRPENWGNLSGYHVYSQNCDHENVKFSLSCVFSADDGKVSLKVWAKYLGTSERFYLVLSENAMDC